MDIINKIHSELTSQSTSLNYKDIIYQFAKELGWNPSYYMMPSANEDFSNGYLSIENGLENTAVLAFLKTPFNDLSYGERKALYSVSYNNLVPWLISIDKNRITYSFILNNTEKGVVEETRIDGHSYEMLRSEAFETIIGKRPTPNIKALDDSLIDNISRWRRLISAELGNNIETVSLSAFFNAIIFVRALEDNNKRFNKNPVNNNNILLEHLPNDNIQTYLIFSNAAKALGQQSVPDNFINSNLLNKLDGLDYYTFKSIFDSFYQSIDGYNYDFSIISKHALSRVYEKYVAELHIESPQALTLFGNIPVEINKKSIGTFYTPEYIARFFAKYVLKEIPYSTFNSIKILEPAVGSGIFMRTLLELLAEKNSPFFDNEQIKSTFTNILALDVDANACQATNLSLALLYLLLYSDFPKLNILNKESVQFLSQNSEYKSSFNLIISNPPYIRYEYLSNELKDFLKNNLEFSELSKGKMDLYLTFLKISADLLSPGGIALFIIPHSFLINEGAKRIRKYIYDNCNIKLLADLSAIPVFGNTGTYSILLIFEKKRDKEKGITIILKCKNSVGQALEDVLNSKEVDNSNYSIYTVSNESFVTDNWLILPNKEYDIEQKINRYKVISQYLDIHSGVITGSDNIFIRNKEDVLEKEKNIYKPYLGDRGKKSYNIPEESEKYIFYHFSENGDTITEEELEAVYPNTWEYLNNNKKQLEERKSQPAKWWMLRSIIHPKNIFIPKIITPELTIIPKFSLDYEGTYVVSHGCYLKLKDTFNKDVDLLFYFLGMLNSTPCYWYVANHSNKYGGGYNKIQPKTLKSTPIPNPYELDRNKLISFIKCVKQRILSSGIQAIGLDKKIDLYACDFYQLTNEEQNIILGDYADNESK
jgi:methylase of polypeptide subunit release factors